MLCHLKQVIGVNRPKQEAFNAENISEIIKNRGMPENETLYAQQFNNGKPKIQKKLKRSGKRDITSLFLKDSYVMNVMALLQHRGTTPIMKNPLKCYFCAPVVTEKNVK